jgi:hypothetical protein
MRFRQERPCYCGGNFPFITYGDDPWPTAVCPKCADAAGQIDQRSVSVTTERLLYRSKAELEGGDYSLSILIGATAVESFLTRLFLKVKRMNHYAETFTWPSETEEKAWEDEYRKKSGGGGFTGPADFVSKATAGTTFDDFVARNSVASKITAGCPDVANLSAKQYFQSAVFRPRNRISHWGYVNASQSEAERCHASAVAIVSILREMDRVKYGAL